MLMIREDEARSSQ